MSLLHLDKITPEFGATVSGFDPSHVSERVIKQLNNALDDYGVLLFPDLQLSEPQQLELANIFGELSKRSRPLTDRVEQSVHSEYMGLVTNIREDGEPIGSLPDGEMWLHHDGCFIDAPYRATILYALEVTSVGGETRFVDMRAVFQSLPDTVVKRIKHLRAHHCFDYRNISQRPAVHELSGLARKASHPVVIKHPNSLKPVLYVNPLCTFKLDEDDIEPSEAQVLLNLLFSVIQNNPVTFLHSWNVGDLIIWDNWSTCHARNDFPAEETRMLRRNIIKGQTLDAYFE